jgi:hypothetical protein
MKMVGHQAKTVNLPSCFLASFFQSGKENSSIVIIAKDRFPVVAAIHDVVNCPRILDAHLPSHTPGLDKQRMGYSSIIKR